MSNITVDKKNREVGLQIMAAVLVLLFVYTAVSKLLDLSTFRQQMMNQSLPDSLKESLVWMLPVIELITAVLLIWKKLRTMGFVLSFGLMLVFTGYVALVLFGFYDRVPCSCGGVLQGLGWEEHLVFNVVFLVLAGVGLRQAQGDQ